MIDPTKITNYNMDNASLEEAILFWVCAAGKNGTTSARCLDNLLNYWRKHSKESPFKTVRRIHESGKLPESMKDHGIGCYNNKSKTFVELINSGLDLKKCTVEDLESIRGIGPKTARCFVIHSRPNQPYAGLDTHVLKFLRDMGHEVPNSTPTGKKYRKLELVFLEYVKKSGMSTADFDLLIWNVYSGKGGTKEEIYFLVRAA